jgi:hypothetical protein
MIIMKNPLAADKAIDCIAVGALTFSKCGLDKPCVHQWCFLFVPDWLFTTHPAASAQAYLLCCRARKQTHLVCQLATCAVRLYDVHQHGQLVQEHGRIDHVLHGCNINLYDSCKSAPAVQEQAAI